VFATDEGLWRDTVARNPGAWPAHNNLGCLLAERQQYDAAIEHFEAALRLYPPNAQAHQNLGRALALKGRWAEAEEHYATSLRLKPAVATRLEYAPLLAHNGKAREAADQYRQVLAARPDQPGALNALAWLLATSRDDAVRNGAEAVRLAERARGLAQGPDASIEGTLAAACAEAGRFPEAIAHARTAMDLALRAGDSRTAALHQRLLMRYRDGQPARE
jgi:Flp pilus assembly protein TadD